jgi:hypothetical protein
MTMMMFIMIIINGSSMIATGRSVNVGTDGVIIMPGPSGKPLGALV